MEQQTIETNSDSTNNFDLTPVNNPIQPSLSSEETNNHVRFDFNTLESFYETDGEDIPFTLHPDQLDEILNEFHSREQYPSDSPISDAISELLGDVEVFHSTESNDMAEPIQSTDEQLAMNIPNDSTLPVIRPHIEKLSTKVPCDQSILLSKSVAVTIPSPNQLRLVHPLENTYRARYKSDYFPQNGNVRRPRYVADDDGNHYVSLQMPSEYSRDFKYEYVRVALITTSTNNRGHFYSPYKFQTNHNDVKVPDQNPIYLPVNAHQGNDFIMKLQLVLIKSKLDQLYDAQPLKPFPDDVGNIQNIISDEKLTSKDLINEYQLDKSHLAFTLCTKLPNGLYDVHPETTIISSVITESAKQSTVANNKPEPIVKNVGKQISCPKCSHCFDPADVDTTERVTKRKSSTSTTRKTSRSTTNNRTIQKKKKTV